MLPLSKLALKMTFNLFLTQRFFALVKTTEYTTSFPSGSGIALLILLNLRCLSRVFGTVGNLARRPRVETSNNLLGTLAKDDIFAGRTRL